MEIWDITVEIRLITLRDVFMKKVGHELLEAQLLGFFQKVGCSLSIEEGCGRGKF